MISKDFSIKGGFFRLARDVIIAESMRVYFRVQNFNLGLVDEAWSILLVIKSSLYLKSYNIKPPLVLIKHANFLCL